MMSNNKYFITITAHDKIAEELQIKSMSIAMDTIIDTVKLKEHKFITCSWYRFDGDCGIYSIFTTKIKHILLSLST